MSDRGRKDTLDVVSEAMFDSSVKLSGQDEQILKIIRDTYTVWLDKPILTDTQIRDYLMVTHGCSKTTAYSYITKIKLILGSVPRASKEFYRHKANYILDKATAAAEAGNDKQAKAFTKIAEGIIKNNNLADNEGEAIPYDEIVPKDWSFSIDPSVAGIKPIPDIARKAKKLLDKYIEDIDNFEYVNDGAAESEIS